MLIKQEKNSSNERIDSLMKTAAAAQEKIDEIMRQIYLTDGTVISIEDIVDILSCSDLST